MLSLRLRGRWSVRYYSSWVAKFAGSTPDDRRIIIENNLLPKANQPETVNDIAQDLTKTAGGIATAIQLRIDLQKFPAANPGVARIDEVVQNWMSVAFCVDSLSLQQVTFDSSGSTLETIARADNVHSVRSISALKKRLHNSRRCYALFHSALPNFPLVFIHVALTKDLAYSMSSLDELVDGLSPPSHAMFYSVNSTSPAFRGLSLAPHLIKATVQDLQEHCPSVKVFSTLSPIPNFLKWLIKFKVADELPAEHIAAIRTVATKSVSANAADQPFSDEQALERVISLLTTAPLDWSKDEAVASLLRGPLMWLAARYITTTRAGKGSIEPVANFHMGNGAEFHRVNWMGNPSLAGLQSSAGLMVNYLYDLPALESNAEAFRALRVEPGTRAEDLVGKGLAVGPAVLDLLRQK